MGGHESKIYYKRICKYYNYYMWIIKLSEQHQLKKNKVSFSLSPLQTVLLSRNPTIHCRDISHTYKPIQTRCPPALFPLSSTPCFFPLQSVCLGNHVIVDSKDLHPCLFGYLVFCCMSTGQLTQQVLVATSEPVLSTVLRLLWVGQYRPHHLLQASHNSKSSFINSFQGFLLSKHCIPWFMDFSALKEEVS
jgi:hypothetical protein